MQDLILEIMITAVILPLLGWGMKVFTDFLNSKIALVKNTTVQKALVDANDELERAVYLAVTEVGETFVKEIKAEGTFTKEDGVKASQMAINITKEIMSEAAMNALADAKVNIEASIRSLIEGNVADSK